MEREEGRNRGGKGRWKTMIDGEEEGEDRKEEEGYDGVGGGRE